MYLKLHVAVSTGLSVPGTRRSAFAARNSVGQRIETVRLPTRHDIDVERDTRRTVRDRCESANQHIGDSVPVEETHE